MPVRYWHFYKMSVTLWIKAFRPRTLPLALSCTIVGSCLAASIYKFRWPVFWLAAVTTVLLQVLANLANDYGDFVNGKDTPGRIGPQRMVQSGKISPRGMLRGIAAVGALCAVSGLALILAATGGTAALPLLAFALLGLAAIAAAVKYTVGKDPYGYRGWGDLLVFIFFGLVGVAGTYFMHALSLRWDIFLPAASVGFLSAGVLNVNNMRDYESDRNAGKRTLPVKMGPRKAAWYHLFLLAGALLSASGYVLLEPRSGWQWLFLLSLPPLALNARAVFACRDPLELYPELQRLSLATLLFSAFFGLGAVLQ
jgi:1,4-dihydroxy-2-naphthoate octaprenyltransferase